MCAFIRGLGLSFIHSFAFILLNQSTRNHININIHREHIHRKHTQVKSELKYA